MAVDVLYQGIVLQRGSAVKDTPSGLFVTLDQPMPVGTALTLDEAGASRAVRVARVHEGVGPGVIVVAQGAGALPKADAVVERTNVPPPSQTQTKTDPAVPTRREDLERTFTDLPPLAPQPRPFEEEGADSTALDVKPLPPPEPERKTVQMEALTPEMLEQLAREHAAKAADEDEAEPAGGDEKPDEKPDDESGGRRGRRRRRKTRV
jgi:hypothetical protein